MKKLFIIFAFLLVPAFAFAQGAAYTVKSATATLKAGGPELRRAPAIGQAANNALPQLLRNLTPQSVWHRHPEALKALSGLDVVHKSSIITEKTSPHYVLEVDITFKADVIKKVLTDLQIPYSEVNAVEVLFLPVLDLPPRQLLWEEHNPWRKAFESQIKAQSGGIIRPVLPVGDAAEMSLISPRLALLGAEDLIKALAAQYGLSDVVVAHAAVVYAGEQRFLEVKNFWYGEEKIETAVTRFNLPASAGFEGPLEKAASSTLAQLSDIWRSTALVEVDKPDRTFLRFTPASATDLQRLQKMVASLSAVKNVKIKMFSLTNSVLQVDFFGDVTALVGQLKNLGLVLEQDGGLWKVAFYPQEGQ